MIFTTLSKRLNSTDDLRFQCQVSCLLSAVLPLNDLSGLNHLSKISAHSFSVVKIESREELGLSGEDQLQLYNQYHNFWTLINAITYPVKIFITPPQKMSFKDSKTHASNLA